MILADTSVWVGHLRQCNARLQGYLDAGEVLIHPFVVGELMLGGLRLGSPAWLNFRLMLETSVATHDEVAGIIFSRSLVGRGIGYVDVHLLASTLLTPGTQLWTLDGNLREVAIEAGVAA